MELEIIKEFHDNGHYAAEKTIHMISQEYFISNLDSKVRKFINNCINCILCNKKFGKKEGELRPIEKGDLPFDTIHIDHIVDMHPTRKQYKHLFVMIDGFTKFVWLYPTKTTTTVETLKKMKSWSEVFGSMKRIVTDRATTFTSNSFEDYCNDNNIIHVSITTGVPRGNGQVERINRVVKTMLTKLSIENPELWYKSVANVQTAINSNVQSSTKCTPFELMFGVKMRNSTIKSDLEELVTRELEEDFDNSRRMLRSHAKEQIKKAQEHYKRTYDEKERENEIMRLVILLPY